MFVSNTLGWKICAEPLNRLPITADGRIGRTRESDLGIGAVRQNDPSRRMMLSFTDAPSGRLICIGKLKAPNVVH